MPCPFMHQCLGQPGPTIQLAQLPPSAPKEVSQLMGMSKGTQAFLHLMGHFPGHLLCSGGLCRARPRSPRPTHQAQAEDVFPLPELPPFLHASVPCAGPWGLLASARDPLHSQAVALPATALPPPANFERPGWGTEEEKLWVKTTVKGSSKGKPPMRRMGIKNSRKYPSVFPWELYTLIRTKFQHLEYSQFVR